MLDEIIKKGREVVAADKSRLSEIDGLLELKAKKARAAYLLRHEKEHRADEVARFERLIAEAEELVEEFSGVRSLAAILNVNHYLEKKYSYEWLTLERLIQQEKPAMPLSLDLPRIPLPSIPLALVDGRLGGATRSSKRKQHKRSKLVRKREAVIFGAIQANLKGPRYCSELDAKKLFAPERWLSEGWPGSYQKAYKSGEKWRKRIQDEKHRFQVKYDGLSGADCQKIIGRFTPSNSRHS